MTLKTEPRFARLLHHSCNIMKARQPETYRRSFFETGSKKAFTA